MANDFDSSSSNDSSDSDLLGSGSQDRGPQPSRNYQATMQQQGSGAFIKWPLWAKVAVAAALIALASIGYMKNHFALPKDGPGPAESEIETEDENSRKPVGDFQLVDIEGKSRNFSEFKGKVIVLSFWASWCEPCLVEMPSFGLLQNKLEKQGLQVIAVNVDEGAEGKKFAPKFWETNKFKFPMFFDFDKSLAQKFGIDMLPSNFIIDRKGRIAFSGFGANDWSAPQTVEMIEALLAEGASGG